MARFSDNQALIVSKPDEPQPAICFCGKEISRDSNYRRLVQVRGQGINTVRDTGCCSQKCLDAWWSDHDNFEHLLEPDYQTNPDGSPVLVDGEPVHAQLPDDSAIELLAHDFISKKKETLVQIMPIQVFADRHEANAWWNTPETDQEKSHVTAARSGVVDHSGTEELSPQAQAIMAAQDATK